MQGGKKQAGFTLIELLIVVAIIAILAAIAVPNFLEAQVRAKVSRSKTDMRTIAVAEEAYRVDWNTYTHNNGAASNPWEPVRRAEWGGYRELTTPVAYITTIPLSPWGRAQDMNAPAEHRPNIYNLGTGNSVSRLSTGAPWSSNANGFPADCFVIDCNGPDNIKDTRDTFSANQYPWAQANANNPVPFLDIAYDPTNGTVSRGQIWRAGGTKPSGSLYEALWVTSSR